VNDRAALLKLLRATQRLAEYVAAREGTYAALHLERLTMPMEPGIAEGFAIKPYGRGAQQLTRQNRRVNEYQAALISTYTDWAEDLADELDGIEDPIERDDAIEAALVALTLALSRLGRTAIPDLLALGLNGTGPSPRCLSDLAEMVEVNESYIGSSLVPTLRDRLHRALQDEAVLAAIGVGILGVLQSFQARVGAYAGAGWAAAQRGVADVAYQQGQAGEDGRIRWVVDEEAKHCPDCPECEGEYDSWDDMLDSTGGKMPGSGVQCASNCRCWLEVWNGSEWVRAL